MKNKLSIYIFIVLSLTINLYSQKQGQELIDSLLIEYPKAVEDTNFINLLSDLSYSYNLISPERGIEYAKKGIEISQKINWKIGLARNYNALMQNYWAIGDFDLALDVYNTGKKIEEELGLYQQTQTSSLTTINKTFTFPSSEYTNLTNEIKKYLNEVVLFMKENPSVVIAITGHSDDFGTFIQNEARSRERAEKVVDFLTKSGISKRRLLANYKGSLDPVAKNDSEEGRRKNRRVVIRTVGK